MSNSILGSNGFVWWVGVVEDRDDPLKLGRCKVRIFGRHSENMVLLPTKDLPWASAMLPINNTSVYTVKEGDRVMGFFMDGENAKIPVMMGLMPTIPLEENKGEQDGFRDHRSDEQLSLAPRKIEDKEYDISGIGITLVDADKATRYPNIFDEPTTSRLARNENIEETFIDERLRERIVNVETVNGKWDEPETEYDAVYPYNNVMETESGHIVEYDDTPGAERIHIAHRNGSFQEWYPEGDKVEKITKDNYTIVMKDDNVYIMGRCNITVQGSSEIYVQEDAFLKVDGDVDLSVGGNFNADIDGTCDIQSGGTMTLTAPKIDLNP